MPGVSLAYLIYCTHYSYMLNLVTLVFCREPAPGAEIPGSHRGSLSLLLFNICIINIKFWPTFLELLDGQWKEPGVSAVIGGFIFSISFSE